MINTEPLQAGAAAAHASTHGVAGSDPVTLAQSQITGLTAALAAKEDTANKSTNVVTDGASDTKYPSVKSVKDYADSIVVGLLDDRGSHDASSNLFPSSGGSGTAGAILKGDIWYISVAGTLGGSAAAVGSSVRALVNTPGQTAANWDILNVGLGFVPENVANKDTDSTFAADSDTKYPTQKAVKTALTTHTGNTSNPHGVTKAQVGLSAVDNTADADKPVSTAQQAALDDKADKLLTTDARTGTSETLVLGNAGQRVTMDNGSANTLTVPPNASVALPINCQILVEQLGTGTTTIAAGGGVTIRSRDSLLALAGRYAVVVLIKDATDTWTLTGDRA